MVIGSSSFRPSTARAGIHNRDPSEICTARGYGSRLALVLLAWPGRWRSALHGIPREYVVGALQRRKRRAECTLELSVDLFRGPAVGAMQGADRAILIEQINLVVAHAENLPGNAGGAVGAEVDRERRDLFRRHLADAGDARLLLLGLGRDRVDHAGPGERRDAVRAHRKALHVERNAARQPDDAHLGRHVVGLTEIADQARCRRHVHEAAGILLAEVRRAGAAHVEAAVQVHADHVGPVRPAHAVKDAIAQNAGIVDQNVDPAERIERRLDDLIGIAGLADRERRGDGRAAGFLDLVDDGLGRSGIGAGAFEAGADIADHDARTLLRHEQRNAAADAPTGARHDGDFAGNDVGHAPLLLLPRFAAKDEINPTPRGPLRRSCAAWPIAGPRPGYCLPRSRRSRIAATGRADRGRRIFAPP